MKLFFMKQSAVDYLKENMKTLYINYYREKDNQWIKELFDYDPFEFFMEVSDFKLAAITEKKGEVDLENCKILYSNLLNISASQAGDERLWAGLCNSTFYGYCRLRWGYPTKNQKTPETDTSAIISRFFFAGTKRAPFYRNTLAKYWWIGHATYQEHESNRFALLDALGPDDLSTKISDLFYSYSFSSNPTIIKGICSAWKIFSDRGIKLSVREYFRPAIQQLNALGGGVLLDVYTDEEIKNIFFDYIQQLYSNDSPRAMIIMDEDELDIESDELTEEELSDEIIRMKNANDLEKTTSSTSEKNEELVTIGETSVEEDIDSERLNKLIGKPEEVTFKCIVVIFSKRKGAKKKYIIPKSESEGTWFAIQKKMLGKKVGDTFFLAGDHYTILDISW